MRAKYEERYFMPTPLQLSIGFIGNLAMTLIIVRGIYYPAARKSKHVFTLIAFNSFVFIMMSVLMSVELGIGTAFGLFALFSVLRYRTEPMGTRDMTYLFILICLPVINALPLMVDGGVGTIMVGNVALIGLLYALERGWGFNRNSNGVKLQKQRVIYACNELLRPENRDSLLAEMCHKTGLPVTRVKVDKINLIENLAELTLYYPSEDESNESTTLEELDE
jgi:hypothetical protein